MTADYYAFLSRMRDGDIIMTNDGTDVYLGVLIGQSAFVASIDNRANLQRTVSWRNPDSPVDYGDLPDEISARLGNPDAELIELTEFIGDLEHMLGEDLSSQFPTANSACPTSPRSSRKNSACRTHWTGCRNALSCCGTGRSSSSTVRRARARPTSRKS